MFTQNMPGSIPGSSPFVKAGQRLYAPDLLCFPWLPDIVKMTCTPNGGFANTMFG